MAFLLRAAGFTFEGHLSIWAIYDSKEQFSKLALWSMHWPTVLLQQRFVLVLPDKYKQKTSENSLAVRTFSERLSVLKRHSLLKLNKC